MKTGVNAGQAATISKGLDFRAAKRARARVCSGRCNRAEVMSEATRGGGRAPR
jgi:hypothetical protein